MKFKVIYIYALEDMNQNVTLRFQIQNSRWLPFIFLPHLSHKLLCGEDELVVDDPAGPVLKEGAVGVDHDSLLVFHRFIITTLTEAGCVIEKSSGDGLK